MLLHLSGLCAMLMTGNLMGAIYNKRFVLFLLPCCCVKRSYLVSDSLLAILTFSCRNRLLLCILNICKDMLGRLPKLVGIDFVEMALWEKVCCDFNL